MSNAAETIYSYCLKIIVSTYFNILTKKQNVSFIVAPSMAA